MEIKRGTLQSFDAGTYKATVLVAESISTALPGIAVSHDIAASDMVAGRRVAILFFEPSNPDDAVLCAVWA